MNGIFPSFIGPDISYRLNSIYPNWLYFGNISILPINDILFIVAEDDRLFAVSADYRTFNSAIDLRLFMAMNENRVFEIESIDEFLTSPEDFS